jgi:hypothetical protein
VRRVVRIATGDRELPVFLGHPDQSFHTKEGDHPYDGTRETIETHYSLYPIKVPRPAKGKAMTVIQCAKCGELLRCTVYSERSTLWLQRRPLIAGYSILGFLIAGWCLIGLVFTWRTSSAIQSLTAGVAVIFGIGSIFALFPVLYMITGRHNEKGVRLHDNTGHSLLRPGETVVIQRFGHPPMDLP